MGGPGCGKAEYSEQLVEEFGFCHLRTGDLLRTEMMKGTKEGDRIKKLMCDGGIIPYEVVV